MNQLIKRKDTREKSIEPRSRKSRYSTFSVFKSPKEKKILDLIKRGS
jgi:hypothetical protein